MANQEKYFKNANKRRAYGCDGKIDYGSWRNAERVAKYSRYKGRAAGAILVPYRCKVCSGFHLMSLDGVERRQQRRDKRNRRGY